MQNILIDAGPLIALFDRDDKYFAPALKFIKNFKGILLTTWPVITEVHHMLHFSPNVQISFLEWVGKYGLRLIDIKQDDLKRIIELSTKYRDIPMDLADASLVYLAEKLNIYDIATIDREYFIYRTKDKKFLSNIFAEYYSQT